MDVGSMKKVRMYLLFSRAPIASAVLRIEALSMTNAFSHRDITIEHQYKRITAF